MESFEELEAIDKWAKDFGEKSLNTIDNEEVDEDGELVATFVLSAAINEFAGHFHTTPEKIGPVVVRRAAAECLMAMLRSGHGVATLSVEGEVIVAITEPAVTGFELV